MSESVVRIAGPADREEIFRLFRLGHEENGLFPPDMERVNWWVTRMLQPELLPSDDTGPRGAIGVIGEPSHLEGLAFLTIGCFWYSAKHHLEEFIVFVDPDCRDKRYGPNKNRAVFELVEWMKEQSRLTGLPLMSGILSFHRTEAKVRLYERMLPKAGAFFCFDPVTQNSSAVQVIH